MEVWYMNGAGNDFMVIDVRNQSCDLPALAVKLCAITGADGFMAIDRSEKADFRLHYYNSDGSRGEMCGNGGRCLCRFAYEKGIAPEAMTMETDAGIVSGLRLSESQYRIHMPPMQDLQPDVLPGVDYCIVGVPHAVMELEGLSWENREAYRQTAQSLRHHQAFPKGANASLYTWLAPGQIRILTFERGVEDYTLACGTGCSSLAAILAAKGKLPEGRLTVHNMGGTLQVEVSGPDIYLTGPTEVTKVMAL